ncbi:MAG: hypothetical protein QMC93_02240 [Patescibacteria group bacterium]|nr:hypothetical protein [Patescibacteria group bacterium]
MKFVVKNKSGENVVNLMRQLGYHFKGQNQESSEVVFIRPIYGLPYPRLHIYLKENKETDEIVFNLHLDQKKPIYKGTTAHSADYEGKVVEREAERIKEILEK